MTTITIKEDIELKKNQFSTAAELRDLLNFMTLEVDEVAQNELSEALKAEYDSTKDKMLEAFPRLEE